QQARVRPRRVIDARERPPFLLLHLDMREIAALGAIEGEQRAFPFLRFARQAERFLAAVRLSEAAGVDATAAIIVFREFAHRAACGAARGEEIGDVVILMAALP